MKQWYVSLNSKPAGPFHLEEVKQLILEGKMNSGTMVSCEEKMDKETMGKETIATDWMPALHFSEIQKDWYSQLDMGVNLGSHSGDQASEDPGLNDTMWVLLLVFEGDKKQFGPVTTDEAKCLVQESRIDKRAWFAWQEGWTEWKSLTHIEDFSSLKLKNDQKDLLRNVVEVNFN
jgi:hypothetical protein